MKDKLFSIIGLDKGTRERTIAGGVITILDFLAVFNIVTFTDEQVQAIVKLVLFISTLVIGFVNYYYNNCHTEANCKHTGLARAENKGLVDYQGITDEVVKDD